MSWRNSELGTLCETITKGTTPRTLGMEYVHTGIPFLRAENLQGGEISVNDNVLFIDDKTDRMLARSRIKPGDVLLSIAGTIGRCAIVPPNAPPMNCNQAVAVIRVSGSLYGKFLLHWLQTEDAQRQMAGAKVSMTISNLSLSEISMLKVPVPPPGVQKRIAEILDKADALREKRRQAIAKLDSLLQSVFLDMFGDPATNSRGWQLKELGSVCTEIYRYPTYYGIQYVEKGVPEVRGELILANGEIDNERAKVRYIAAATSNKFPRTILDIGDLVLSVRGTIGKVGFVDDRFKGANITANLIRISPNRRRLNPRFLWHLCRSESFQRNLESVCSSTTIQTIKAPDLKSILIPIPPMESQERYARFFTSWKKLRTTLNKASERTQYLFQSLQHHAFTSELPGRAELAQYV